MPIDPSIPLAVRPAQMPDPIEAAGRVYSLKNIMAQGPIRDQQMQAAAMQNEAAKLRLEQQQQDLQDQQTMRDVVGQYGGDMSKALPALAGKISPRSFQALQAFDQQARKNALSMDKAKWEIRSKENDQLLGLTSQALDLPPDQYAQQWPTLRAAALRIKPDLQLPEQPVPQDQLRSWRTTFMTEKHYLDEKSEKRQADVANSTIASNKVLTEGRQMDNTQKRIESASAELSGATDQSDYDSKLDALVKGGKLSAAEARRFPASFDASTVRRAGMTPEQQENADLRQSGQDALADYREQNMQMRKDLAAASRDAATDRRNQTQNSAAIDRRQARKDFNEAESGEGDLWLLTTKLRNAIHSGNLYVDDKGRTFPMDKAAGEEQKTVDDLKSEMQSRLANYKTQLKRAVANKYDAMDRLGATPKVSMEAVYKDIDAIGQQSTQPAAPAAAPAPAPAPTPKPAPAPAPAAAQPAPAREPSLKFAVGGVTYTVGQEISSRGKKYKITGFANGKIQAQPIP